MVSASFLLHRFRALHALFCERRPTAERGVYYSSVERETHPLHLEIRKTDLDGRDAN